MNEDQIKCPNAWGRRISGLQRKGTLGSLGPGDFLDVGQSWDLENEGTWRGIPSGVWAGEQAGDKQWS